MALTNEQLLQRITNIELKLNEMQTAVNNLATKKQLNMSVNIRQNEITDLQARVADLEAQVQTLQSS
jgi:predicted nuclease with TOPRIM domain